MVGCMLSVVASAAGGYLLGSVSGALLLGRFRNVDIRRLGSGNPGATNALRTVGWSFAAAVVLVDLGKGVVAAAVIPPAAALVAASTASMHTLAAASGTAAVVGHIWPLFFRFRGGKGASTLVGVIAVVAPWCLIPMLLVWGITLLGSGYVGLATILASISLVPAMWTLGPEPLPASLAIMSLLLAMLLVFTHRGNLMRMRAGEENRFDKARVIRRR